MINMNKPSSAIRRGITVFCIVSLILALIGLSYSTANAQPVAYVTNSGSNTVSVIDTATNTVGPAIAVASGPDGVAITPDGARAYVVSTGPRTVSVIDTTTSTVIATVIVGSSPIGVAITPDGAFAYVTNQGSNTVSVIATATNTVVATVAVGSGPLSVAITPDGSRAYVTNGFSNNVSVIDTASNTVVATVVVGSPRGVAITPDGVFAYVVNTSANNVSVIDTATNTVVGTVAVGSGPNGVVITPDGAFAYVTNGGSGNVSVIDTATNTVLSIITVGSGPSGAATTLDGASVYVVNIGSANVSVIDTATNTVVDLLAVGSFPREVATTRRRLVVTNTNDSGPGSLRQVILDARDNVPSVITFDPAVFPVASPGTISLLTRLPVLSDPGDMIDGSNRGVIVDGSNLSLAMDHGLRVRTSNITIRELTIQNFPDDGINVQPISASGETITGVVIRNNLILGNLSDGVRISAGDNTNRIGTIIGGNIISGNEVGVSVFGGNNNNRLEVTVTGNSDVSNNTAQGILVIGGNNNNQLGVTISGNSFFNNIDQGILVSGSNMTGNGGNNVILTISGNTIRGGQPPKIPSNPRSGDGIGINGGSGTNAGNNVVQAIISDNLIHNSFGEGLRVNGAATGSSSSNNTIDATITGNNIRNNGLGPFGGSGNGITITGGPALSVPATTSGNRITFLVEGNQSNNNRDNGIGVQGWNGSRHEVTGTISNNTSNGNTLSGISLIARGTDNTLKDIAIVSNIASDNLQGGLTIFGGDSLDSPCCSDGTKNAHITNILVDGNRFDKNALGGISATLGTGPGNFISFAGITNNSISSNGGDGLFITAGVNGNATLISENDADKNRGDGIDIRATGYILSQNRADDNKTGAGISAVGNTNGGGNRGKKNASCNEPNFCF
jgi:YVTN family beta-propeller protein